MTNQIAEKSRQLCHAMKEFDGALKCKLFENIYYE